MQCVKTTKLLKNLTHQFLIKHRHFCVRRSLCQSAKAAKLVADYSLLQLSPQCTATEARVAFIELAKKYHPDGNTGTADAAKFSQIEEAYRNIQDDLDKRHEQSREDFQAEFREGMEAMETEEKDYGIKHTVPQHRQYLSYEGVGYGSPSQRQRQYQQIRVMQASERVHEYRKEIISAMYEDALVVKDKKATRKRKTSSGIERLVEDMIQQSMANGEFDNLPGQGKPLEYRSENPYVDTTTHNLNQMMINNGFVPEWIMLDKDIRENINKARSKLARSKHELDTLPSHVDRQLWWAKRLEAFRTSFRDINKDIHKLNMVVPSMNQQMIPYDIEKMMQLVLEKYQDYLGESDDEQSQKQQSSQGRPRAASDVDNSFKDAFNDLWMELKSLVKKQT